MPETVVGLNRQCSFPHFREECRKNHLRCGENFHENFGKTDFCFLQKRENVAEPENMLMTCDFGGFSENILVFASDFREHCANIVENLFLK
jgi:hypothetical protein